MQLISPADSDHSDLRLYLLTGFARGYSALHRLHCWASLCQEPICNAATWNSANWQVAAVLGPAIGGLVYGFWGIVPAYSLVLGLYTLSVFIIMFIKAGDTK